MLVILSKTSPNWYVLFFYFLLNWSHWVNSLKLDPRSGRFSEGLEHSTANSGKCRSDFEELRVNTYALLTVAVCSRAPELSHAQPRSQILTSVSVSACSALEPFEK